MPYGNNAGGGIRSRAQHLVTSVMGRRPGNSNRSNQSHQHQQLQQQQQQLQAVRSATTGSLIRSKTFMLDHAGRLIQGEKWSLKMGVAFSGYDRPFAQQSPRSPFPLCVPNRRKRNHSHNTLYSDFVPPTKYVQSNIQTRSGTNKQKKT